MTAIAVEQSQVGYWGRACCEPCDWVGPLRVYESGAARSAMTHNARHHTVRRDAQVEASRMWPEATAKGKWDGVTISAERALLIQREAFVMGAEWAKEANHEPN